MPVKKIKKIAPPRKKKGFSYDRSLEQIIFYRQISARRKLEWLEEMWQLNNKVAKQNPRVGFIQKMFRNGEI
jgi:hypothetical protein